MTYVDDNRWANIKAATSRKEQEQSITPEAFLDDQPQQEVDKLIDRFNDEQRVMPLVAIALSKHLRERKEKPSNRATGGSR